MTKDPKTYSRKDVAKLVKATAIQSTVAHVMAARLGIEALIEDLCLSSDDATYNKFFDSMWSYVNDLRKLETKLDDRLNTKYYSSIEMP